MAKGNRIPEISDERLAELALRIRPVVRFARVRTTSRDHKDGSFTITTRVHPKGKLQTDDRGKLHFIKPLTGTALRDVAFPWDPKPLRRRAYGLLPVATITTYHTFGYHGFFKPSVAEVLAQIPAELIDRVSAFETNGPNDADDLNRHLTELNEGYHVAQTTLYSRKR